MLRDIVEPNATINPDHVSYMVDVKNAGKLAGLLRREGEDLRVVENAEKSTLVPRGDVEHLRVSPISLMPEGYKELGHEKLRDLLTFLTTEPPKARKATE